MLLIWFGKLVKYPSNGLRHRKSLVFLEDIEASVRIIEALISLHNTGYKLYARILSKRLIGIIEVLVMEK